MADFDNSFLVEDAGDDSIHEDALVFELAEDQPVGWRASGLAIKRASDRGMELGEVLEDLRELFDSPMSEEELEEMSEEEIEKELGAGASFAQLIGLVSKLVWLGALHFEPNVSRKRVLAAMDSEALARVPLEEMLSKVFPALSEEVQHEEEEEGKA